MKRNRQTKLTTLSHSRWLAYATAGAATAVGATPSAEAEIHYSGPIDFRFKHLDERVRSFALDNSAKIIFLHGYGVPYNGDFYYGDFFGITGAAISNQFRGYHAPRGYILVSRLDPRELVSQGVFRQASFAGPLAWMARTYGTGPWGTGIDGNAGGFVGFRFDNGAGMQYGWARVKVRNTEFGVNFGFNLVDYAWSDPGEPIMTGQTSERGDMVNAAPDSGSLGLLALGGVGLRAWREHRAQSAP